MNICAVRTIIKFDANSGGIFDVPLPHEPKTTHRFALRILTPEHEANILGNWLGNYAECKHCDCIYAELED